MSRRPPPSAAGKAKKRKAGVEGGKNPGDSKRSQLARDLLGEIDAFVDDAEFNELESDEQDSQNEEEEKRIFEEMQMSKQLRRRSSSWEGQFRRGRSLEFIRLRKDSLWTEDSENGAALRNLGNTCFLNAAMQCLAHTAPLVDYFVGTSQWEKDSNPQNPLGSGGTLAEEFKNLLGDLFSSTKPVPPTQFKLAVSSFSQQFCGAKQHDVQEFLVTLLDGLHEDLNRVTKKPYVEFPPRNGRSDEQLAAEQWRIHLLRNKSIIVDLLQGQLRSSVSCKTCKEESVTFDPFMTLSLPLPDKSGGKSVKLERLIEQFLNPEELSGDEQWFCPSCREMRDAVKKFDIWKVPPILVIHLKRFKFERDGVKRAEKLNTNVKFPLHNFRIDDFVSSVQKDKPHFDLFAVARHHGGSSGGHYTAVARSRHSRTWRIFNDECQRAIRPVQVQSKNSYVLFFERREVGEVGYRRQSVSRPVHWPHNLAPSDVRHYEKLSLQ